MRSLARHWFVIVLTATVAVGLRWPHHFDWLIRWMDPGWNVAAVMLLNALALDSGQFLRSLKRPLRVLTAVFGGYLIVASLGYFAAILLAPTSRDFALGLLVISAMPTTLASAVIWTRLAGGNDAFALVVTIASNMLSFVVAPMILFVTVGSLISLDPFEMVPKLALVVILPVVAGQALSRIGGVSSLLSRHKVVLSVLSRLLTILIVFTAVTAGVREVGVGGDHLAIYALGILTVAVIAVHGVAAVLCWAQGKALGWGRSDRLAFVFTGAQKTLPAALYVCAEFFPTFSFATIPCVSYHVFQLLFDSWLVEIIRTRKRRARATESNDP